MTWTTTGRLPWITLSTLATMSLNRVENHSMSGGFKRNSQVGRTSQDFTVDRRQSAGSVIDLRGVQKEARLKWVVLLARPSLAWEAVLTAWDFRSRYGLLPARAILEWRLATAYGTTSRPLPHDLIGFLGWRRDLRAARRRAR